MEKPIAKAKPNIEELKEITQEYIDYIDSDKYHEDGAHKRIHYIFETALTTVFGDNIFDWINKRVEEHEE